MTRRETVHGGSTPASMRVMVIANCARLTSLAVNEVAVNVVKFLKDMLNILNLVPFGTAAPTLQVFYFMVCSNLFTC